MIGHGIEHVGKGIGRHRIVRVYALEQVTGDSWSAHPHQKNYKYSSPFNLFHAL
jgi:hypothetical protein